MKKELTERSGNSCELCKSTDDLDIYEIPPTADGTADTAVWICAVCREQINDPEKTDVNHWRCLNDSMWSQVPAVQVTAWRMLNRLKHEGWPQDLLDMLYLDDETLRWAQNGADENTNSIQHRDSNGNILQNGDTVTLIKDLDVKGANFTAKRGTAVRRISLAEDNPEHIEGKVNGQQIVILTKYVKKTS